MRSDYREENSGNFFLEQNWTDFLKHVWMVQTSINITNLGSLLCLSFQIYIYLFYFNLNFSWFWFPEHVGIQFKFCNCFSCNFHIVMVFVLCNILLRQITGHTNNHATTRKTTVPPIATIYLAEKTVLLLYQVPKENHGHWCFPGSPIQADTIMTFSEGVCVGGGMLGVGTDSPICMNCNSPALHPTLSDKTTPFHNLSLSNFQDSKFVSNLQILDLTAMRQLNIL